MPLIRGIEHQIDFILEIPILNKPAYRSNPKETKEMKKQVKELLAKSYIRESSMCHVGVTSVEEGWDIENICGLLIY